MEAAAQSSFFALGAAAAAATGGGLRTLETRRIRAVHEARRSQRLQLAGDLHDFVAHDVSGIVVLAQAAQVIGADRPEEVLPLLRQIEASGLQALGSMDRTVHMLRSSDGTAPASTGRRRTRRRRWRTAWRTSWMRWTGSARPAWPKCAWTWTGRPSGSAASPVKWRARPTAWWWRR